MAAVFADAFEGLEQTASIVPASSACTLMGWTYISDTPGLGTTRTLFYLGNDPQLFFSQYVWIIQRSDGLIEMQVDGVGDFTYGVPTGMRHHLAYRRSGTSHQLYLNGALHAARTQNVAAETHTHIYCGTDTYAVDWQASQAAYVRMWNTALTPAEINAERLSPTVVKTANLWFDTPLESDLLDDSGNGRDWVAYGGTITFTDQPGLPTRLYPLVKCPPVFMEGPSGGTWQWQAGGPDPHTPCSFTWLADTSKIVGVGQTARTQFCNQQGNYDVSMVGRWVYGPLAAGTITAPWTFDLCFLVRALWQDGVGFTADSVVRYKCHAYLATGADLNTPRATLLNNYLDPIDYPFSSSIWRQFDTPQALPTVTIHEGDYLVIEPGSRIVSSPTPAVTYPPEAWTEIRITGTGASNGFVDAVNGDTSTSRAPWFEFSQPLPARIASTSPANATCATALVIPSLPYTSPRIDTTAAPDTHKRVWFTFTAPASGDIFIDTRGSNYRINIDIFTGTCAALVAASPATSLTDYWAHRSGSMALLKAVAGTTYFLRVETDANSNCADFGGNLRLSVWYRQTAQEDDLYMPATQVVAYREGFPVNMNPNVPQTPLGIAIDYTRRSMANVGSGWGGNPHTGEKLHLGLFHGPNMDELFDLPTMGFDLPGGSGDIDIIHDPWDLATPQPNDAECGIYQLYIGRTSGQLVALFAGNGAHYVSGFGTRPAAISTISSNPSFSATKVIDAIDGDNQAGAPFSDVEHFPTVEVTAPLLGAVDFDTGVLYYASGSYYVPVGGQEIRRYNLNTATQLPVFATLPIRAVYNPGIRGMCLLPGDGGMLVCNADVVHRLNSSGAIVGTYTPSLPLYSRTLVDVKVTADGRSAWVVDLWTVQLYKFDLETMAEIATYPTYAQPGSVIQMVLYQPNGIAPAPPPGEGAAACPIPTTPTASGQAACPAPSPSVV